MPSKSAPEFSYNPKTGMYRKRIKDPATGKWVDVYGHTKQELRDKVDARKQQLAASAVADTSPYVYQYAKKWYELNTNTIGAKRKEDYSNAINNHICTVIGDKQLYEITPDDIREVMAEASELSKSAQAKIVTTLKRIFDAAEENNLIPRSPCRTLKPGGAAAMEKQPLTPPQQAALLDAVKGTAAETFVAIGLYSGLRREEILALQWDCVFLDSDTPYIAVRRALRWQNNRPVVEQKLKSKAAKRDIPIPQQLVDHLKRVKTASKSDYVMCDKKGEPMSSISFRRRVLDPIMVRTARTTTIIGTDGQPAEKAYQIGDKVRNHPIFITLDFKVTPHLLRHTYISTLILSGANIKTVQYLAGHATVQLTLNIYAHLMDNQPKDTAGAVLGAFGGKSGGK